MMQGKRALWASWVASPLALAIADAHAEAPCRAGHAVDLTIELEPPEAAARQQLQQRLAAEMRARDLDVCARGTGESSLAHVRVSAPLPELSPTWVKIRTAQGAAVERNLDVAVLPLEARPSAIASATDELLSSLLQGAAASPAPDAVAATEDSATDATAPPAPEAAWELPRLELGLGGGGALFEPRGRAFRGELLARWRPLTRLSTTLRVGGDRRLTGETVWSDAASGVRTVDRASGWHAGLDVGLELTEPAEGFGLAAVAGLALARLELIEEGSIATGVMPYYAGSTWEAAANAGGEVSFRARGWGADLALSVLLPLTPREKNWETWRNGLVERTGQNESWSYSSISVVPPGAGFGEQLGGQLDLRLWVALDS